MHVREARVAHDLLTSGLAAAGADVSAASDAMRRAQGVLVDGLALIDLDGSFSAEHVFAVFERATLALGRARREGESRALVEVCSLLAPLAASLFPSRASLPPLTASLVPSPLPR